MTESLALTGHRMSEIQDALRELGLAASLTGSEIEKIMAKVDAARNALPLGTSKLVTRGVGIAAILITAVLLYEGRGSFLLVFLGMWLVIWPRLRKPDLKNPFRIRW